MSSRVWILGIRTLSLFGSLNEVCFFLWRCGFAWIISKWFVVVLSLSFLVRFWLVINLGADTLGTMRTDAENPLPGVSGIESLCLECVCSLACNVCLSFCTPKKDASIQSVSFCSFVLQSGPGFGECGYVVTLSVLSMMMWWWWWHWCTDGTQSQTPNMGLSAKGKHFRFPVLCTNNFIIVVDVDVDVAWLKIKREKSLLPTDQNLHRQKSRFFGFSRFFERKIANLMKIFEQLWWFSREFLVNLKKIVFFVEISMLKMLAFSPISCIFFLGSSFKKIFSSLLKMIENCVWWDSF